MYPNGWNETTTNEVGCYYSFNYSNVHFAVLDNLENDSRVLSQEQLNWLDEDLARNKDNWKFLTFHLSMYSTSDHGPDPKMQEQLEPLMYKHKVNALFFGHDHIYESYHVNSTSTEYPGTYAFLCAGGGGSLKPVTSTPTMGERVWNGTTNEHGNFILEVQHSNNPAIHQLEGSEYQIYGERVHHYMSVELEGESATFRAYRTIDDSLIQEFVNVSRT